MVVGKEGGGRPPRSIITTTRGMSKQESVKSLKSNFQGQGEECVSDREILRPVIRAILISLSLSFSLSPGEGILPVACMAGGKDDRWTYKWFSIKVQENILILFYCFRIVNTQQIERFGL